VLSQLSRPAKVTNPEPGLTDLRASGSLEQDADVAMFLHAADGKLGSGPRRLIVAKQRCGPVDSFPVMFDGTRQLFSEITEGGE
jgi:replicative DNA helicase